jgi:hypothetical protein
MRKTTGYTGRETPLVDRTKGQSGVVKIVVQALSVVNEKCNGITQV